MSVLKWEEPAPDGRGGRGGTSWAAVAAELKQNPGAWALVGEDVSIGTTGRLRKRYGLEVTVRGVKNNRVAKVYARFVPEASE